MLQQLGYSSDARYVDNLMRNYGRGDHHNREVGLSEFALLWKHLGSPDIDQLRTQSPVASESSSPVAVRELAAQHAAALRIQAVWRGGKTRERVFERLAEEMWAAKEIQRWWRGFSGRRRLVEEADAAAAARPAQQTLHS